MNRDTDIDAEIPEVDHLDQSLAVEPEEGGLPERPQPPTQSASEGDWLDQRIEVPLDDSEEDRGAEES